MTKPEKIEEIRKACILANPEIVELKFGCEVIDKGFNHQNNSKGVFIALAMEDNIFMVYENGDVSWAISKSQIEILGRPIRLSDVLLAIERSDKTGWHIYSNGEFAQNAGYNEMYLEQKICGINESHIRWNLLKDSLEDQDEPCLTFLVDLLRK